MTEKIYTTKKNGMTALLLTLLLMAAGIACIVFGAVEESMLLFLGLAIILFGWIPFLGLRILKPQEALVLTLFGQYKGTIKGDGFYFVNPFCSAINPAASTKLAQSGESGPASPIPGLKFGADGSVLTNGGRVLGVVAKAGDLKAARAKAYKATEKITFANKYMRHDIGKAIDEA